MGFQQGLSGLNAASKSLEVIGNNVANASTVGFKQAQTQFADVYANSMNGAGASSVGIGVTVSNVKQQFTQGSISATNSPLDMAINGQGFFRVNHNGVPSYSRNGQFQLDKSGFIVNAGGARLTGFAANASGVLNTATPVDLHIDTADIPPKTTSKVGALVNLDSRSATLTEAGFDPAVPTTYNNATSVSVFDSLGNVHALQTFYVKTAPGAWSVFAATDGVPVGAPPAGTAIGHINFKTDGSIDAATTTMPFVVAAAVTTGATSPFSVNLDYAGSTQFGSTFSVNAQSQDGYASGRLAGFNIGGDGNIVGAYTNGQSSVLGQVVLANFANPNGLQPTGNNLWAETAASGAALVGSPNTGGLGMLQSSAVEESNVDLTAELVNMITAQRVYQANAQTIKTQDQAMQTLVNLR